MRDKISSGNIDLVQHEPVLENRQADRAKKRKKVALLGTVPHKLLAPFGDPEFEIWAIAHACLGDPLPRVDRIFEIHKWDEVVKWGSLGAFEAWPTVPKYLIEARPDVPNSVTFPFDALAAKFQIFNDREESLMTNSISWMMALAMDEGFEEIHIYGVNMSHSSEYSSQKPSCEYYLGLAAGRGIKIYVPKESDLCKSYFLYGKDEEKQTDLMVKMTDRLNWLQTQMNNFMQQRGQVEQAIQQHIGAIEDVKFWMMQFKH